MPKLFKDLVRDKDIRYVVETAFEDAVGDIIHDLISDFTSTRPKLGAAPKNVLDAVYEWLANSEASEYGEDD